MCEQLLLPTEEWKSVALSGLSPTVVMECAGRALSFWSYQMTNQMFVCPPRTHGLCWLWLTGRSSYHARKNSKMKDYCVELQGEIENIWGQANQRISTLTTKLRGQFTCCWDEVLGWGGVVSARTANHSQTWSERSTP